MEMEEQPKDLGVLIPKRDDTKQDDIKVKQ